jgi:hypothetical protein
MLVMVAGALGLVAGVIGTINSSRRFLYLWPILWGNIILIPMQAAFIWKFDLSTVKAVLWFNVVSAVPSLGVAIYTAFYGFARGGRKIAGIDYRNKHRRTYGGVVQLAAMARSAFAGKMLRQRGGFLHDFPRHRRSSHTIEMSMEIMVWQETN